MLRGPKSILALAVACVATGIPVAGAQPDALIGPPAPDGPEIQGPDAAAPTPATPASEALPLGGSEPAEKRPSPFAARRAAADSLPQSQALPVQEGWWRTAGALLMVIAIIVALGAAIRAWAARSGGLATALGPGGRSPAGLLQVLGRYPVGRSQTLVLLKLDRRVLLLCQAGGVKGGAMRTLCELTDPEDVASVLMLTSESEGRSISAKFREMISGFEGSHDRAEQVLAPIAVPERPMERGADPLGSLRSRLDSLRERNGPGAGQ